jgi:hypothetical protein
MANADPVLARRAAVVTICETAANSVIDRVVDEALHAAGRFGLTRERANEYTAGIQQTLPRAFAAMKMPDGLERSAAIDGVAAAVRAVSDAHHIPRIVERGLVVIAVRIAREVIRRRAPEQGFTPEELESEFVSFAQLLEDRLSKA